MSLGLGLNGFIGLAQEVTWGTPVTANKFIEISEEGMKLNQKPLYKGVLGSPSQRYNTKSKRTAGGPIKMPMIYQGQEYLLKHLMGSVASAQIGATGVYTHTFSLATALPVGLTAVVNRDADAIGGSSCFEYPGAMVNKATFSQEIEEFLSLEVELECKDENLIAKPTPTFPAFKGIQWDEVSTLTIGGVTIPAEMLEFSIDNALAGDRHKLGIATRKGLGRGDFRKCTGKINLEFEDLTLYNYFRSLSTAGALNVIWTGPIAAGSTPYRLRIAATNVMLEGDTPGLKEPGPIKIEMPFSCPIASGGASNSEVSIELDNLLTSVT